MSITIQAVYEGGVLRPVQPLALPEGKLVDVTVAMTVPIIPETEPMTPAEREYARRMKAARSLEEMFEVMATAEPFPEDYDLERALIENRKATGERTPFPDTDRETGL